MAGSAFTAGRSMGMAGLRAPAGPMLIPGAVRRADAWLREKLARVTSTGRVVPELEGLRFVAIAAVVLFHTNGTLVAKFASAQPAGGFENGVFALLTTGDVGVRLFFVISGFILCLPFAEQHLLGGRPISLKKYFVRRLTRLEPPYIINLLLITALLVLVVHKYTLGEIAGNLAASCVYLHNLVYGDWSKVNSVAWSLEVEVQFYILAPLLARVFLLPLRLRRGVLAAAIAAVCLVNAFVVPFERSTYILTLPYHIHYFLTGFLLADLFIVDWKEAPVRQRRWDLIGGVCWLVMAPVKLHPIGYNLVLPALVLLAYIGAFRGPALNALFRRPWLVTIGGMCYTIYLYHAVVITALGTALQSRLNAGGYTATLLIFGGLACGLTLIVSSVMFVLFEKPFMRRDWPQSWASNVRTLIGR